MNADGSTGPGDGDSPGPGRLDQPNSHRYRHAIVRLLVRASDATTRWVTRLLGESPSSARADLSGEELREMVAHSTTLNREERRLIDEVLTVGDRNVRELMVPRTEVTFLDAADTVEDAVVVARATLYSRFPVIESNHDDVVGFVHLRDLVLRPDPDPVRTVGELARPLRQLPTSKLALAALSEMRRAGDHLALVVDEYGGTAGIVTLEDLLEELVGEIHDEYDGAPTTTDGVSPTEVDGLLNLSDFAEQTGISLPTGPYDTVGGFIMAQLGRLAVQGDEVTVVTPSGDWLLRVVAMEGRRIGRVSIAEVVPVPAFEALPIHDIAPELV